MIINCRMISVKMDRQRQCSNVFSQIHLNDIDEVFVFLSFAVKKKNLIGKRRVVVFFDVKRRRGGGEEESISTYQSIALLK